MNNEPARSSPAPVSLIAAAFATVYLVWGSTYLAIRFAIESLPPFLMAGCRFVVAGAILYTIMRLRGSARPTGRNWKSAAIAGCLLLVGGNGLVSWAEQFVPSGLAAMIIATIPAWMATIDRVFHNGPRFTVRIVLGLFAGLLGVSILLGPSEMGGHGVHVWGGLALLAACVFWTIGSLYSRQADLPISPFLATATEMVAGGTGLLVLGTALGEWTIIDVGAISTKSAFALFYLIVFGSIIALSAYTWLLRVTTSARVATYAYVNPVVAMFLGYAVADEPMSPRVLAASGIILAAVVLITTTRISVRPLNEEKARLTKGQFQRTDVVVAPCTATVHAINPPHGVGMAGADMTDVD